MKKIKNLDDLNKRLIEIQLAVPELPFGWYVDDNGCLGDKTSDHYYQQDEAVKLAKALFAFYGAEQ